MVFPQNTSMKPWQLEGIKYKRYPKPPYTYLGMIVFAINMSPERKLTLQQVCDSLSNMFKFFRGNYRGWRDSVRHNLSRHPCFYQDDGHTRNTHGGSAWLVDSGELPDKVFKRQKTNENGWGEDLFQELNVPKTVILNQRNDSSEDKSSTISSTNSTFSLVQDVDHSSHGMPSTRHNNTSLSLNFGIDNILSESFGKSVSESQSDSLSMFHYYSESSCERQKGETTVLSNQTSGNMHPSNSLNSPNIYCDQSYESFHQQLSDSVDVSDPFNSSTELPRNLSGSSASSISVDHSCTSVYPFMRESSVCSLDSCCSPSPEPDLSSNAFLESLLYLDEVLDGSSNFDISENEVSQVSVPQPTECNDHICADISSNKICMSNTSIERELKELQNLADIIMSCDHNCSSELCRDLKECFRNVV